MVFSCFAVYLRIIMHGLYHILLVVYGPQGGQYTTQNMVQPVHDYPRRYTAKQLKTIYYSLNKHPLVWEESEYRNTLFHILEHFRPVVQSDTLDPKIW